VQNATQKAEAVGTNVKETVEHEAQKANNSTGLGEKTYTEKAQDLGTNVKETIEHEAQKANNSTGVGEKTYLEQAQDLAASALNTASQAASGKFSVRLRMFVEARWLTCCV
jgi:hypothetical protein